MKRRLNLRVARGLVILLLIVAWMPGPVKAAEPVTIWAGLPSEPAVALTFDDGPCSRYTTKILALLNQYQARATFFVLGCKVEKCPRLIKAMLRAGHEVGNHTFSHPRLTKTDQPGREREIETTSLDLELLGCPRKHQLIRPPYSASDDRLVSYTAHTRRQLVMWSIDSGDWRGLDARTIAYNVLSRVRNGSIIVMHDSDEKERADRNPTVEALRIVLPTLRDWGYRLVTVSELMAEKHH